MIPTQPPLYDLLSFFSSIALIFFSSIEIKKIRFLFCRHISSFGGLHPDKTIALILSLLFSQIIKDNNGRRENETIKMAGLCRLGQSVNLMFPSP